MITQETIDVSGMQCGSCEQALQRALRQIDGVRDVQADHQEGSVRVRFDTEIVDRARLATAIHDTGYDT